MSVNPESVYESLRSVVISASGTTSTAAAVKPGEALVGIMMPSGWTTADITFTTSYDEGTTFQAWNDADGNAVTVTSPAASKNISLSYVGGLGFDQIKLVSSATQTSERTIYLKFVKILGA